MGEDFRHRQRSRAHARNVAVLVLLGLPPFFASDRATSHGIDPVGLKQAMVVTLTREDNDKTIEVHAGDSIVVRLPENPTTGFAWAIDRADDEVLRLQSSEYSPAAGVGVGGGGQRNLTFKAIRPGTVTLRLKLWRDWEGDKSVTDRFTTTIRVMQGTPPGNALKG
jgi:inhibitor of cysteine peptidase